MKRLLLILFSIIAFSIPTLANTVSDVAMDVLIHDDGSATITQRWQGSFNEGTEVYLPLDDKELVVNNFRVFMDDTEFTNKSNWDVNASFDRKAYKCGINETSSGVELCFGISKYGNNTYTFTYRVDPVVKSYADYDGFNFQFLNPGMDVMRTNVTLRMRLDNGKKLTTDNARIWGFGFDGETEFRDGYILAFTDSIYTSYNYLNLLFRLDKGIISPKKAINESFDAIYNRAMAGSDYEEAMRNQGDSSGFDLYDLLFMLISIAIFIIPIIIVLVVIISRVKRKSELKKFYKDANYFRDNPNRNDMAMSYVLFNDYNIWNSNTTNVIGAIIMRMINFGCLEVIEEKSVGFFGKENVTRSLRLKKEPNGELEQGLYRIIVNAAGADGILQENELKNYANKNYTALNSYLEGIETTGHSHLNKEKAYIRLLGNRLRDLSEIGKNELAEVYGLRKFLDEFTLIKERSILEGIIWEDLLVYATLFGIAEKVLSELIKLYPQKLVEIENYASTVYVSTVYYRALYNTSMRASNAAKMTSSSLSGLGGHTSFGGGGGFSGGGSGGGTR